VLFFLFSCAQVSDLFGGRRAVVIGTFMCTLVVFLAVFAVYSEGGMGPAPLLVMLACMGILVGGCVGFCFAVRLLRAVAVARKEGSEDALWVARR
jgi:sugar phosphate permease